MSDTLTTFPLYKGCSLNGCQMSLIMTFSKSRISTILPLRKLSVRNAAVPDHQPLLRLFLFKKSRKLGTLFGIFFNALPLPSPYTPLDKLWKQHLELPRQISWERMTQ